MLSYLAGRLAIVAVYYLVRLLPVVGLKLSGRYERRIFGPLVEDVSVNEVRAERSGRSVLLEIEFDNDSNLDAHVAGGNVRLGGKRNGETVCNLVWLDDFASTPKNVEVSKIEAEGAGTLRLERRLDGEENLWVDGELRLHRIIAIRGRELPLGTADFSLPERSVTVEPSGERRGAATDD
ncbi:hypothetical protein [Haladaptatus salinisoli]|uniref:hypothetical protein n=1 Tax=Haladaptatus salinisoli TaxID=2884876 RepID=UPI001D09B430|nr:hypothetical protein [Haladaptatus salinisoli]